MSICHCVCISLHPHIVSVCHCVYMSLCLVAHQLKVSDDRMTVTGDKGYCVIRANHGKCI